MAETLWQPKSGHHISTDALEQSERSHQQLGCGCKGRYHKRGDPSSVSANSLATLPDPSSKTYSGFNEPDNSGQADMTVAQAVAAWKQYMEPYHTEIKLVSPAVT